jgi:hypothetical protein
MPLDRRSFLRFAVAWLLAATGPWCLADLSSEQIAKLLSVPIERRVVTSTSIAGLGYHPRLEVLEVAFRSGAVYRYFGVPRPVFDALMKADSKGRYFSQTIRNRFEFRRVEGPRP